MCTTYGGSIIYAQINYNRYEHIVTLLRTNILKFGNKNYKNRGTKVAQIWETKLQKTENKNYKNPGTKL
jgi:hypothetical protein